MVVIYCSSVNYCIIYCSSVIYCMFQEYLFIVLQGLLWLYRWYLCQYYGIMGCIMVIYGI